MQKAPDNRSSLMQYMTFAWQLIAGLAIAVYLGMLIDKKLNTSIPLLVWILPLLVIISMIVKVIKDTSKRDK